MSGTGPVTVTGYKVGSCRATRSRNVDGGPVILGNGGRIPFDKGKLWIRKDP
jgi:hypothetical protein